MAASFTSLDYLRGEGRDNRQIAIRDMQTLYLHVPPMDIYQNGRVSEPFKQKLYV